MLALRLVVPVRFPPPMGKGGELDLRVRAGRAHRPTVFDLDVEEWREMQVLLANVRALIDERVEPDGYNVDWNVFPADGQRVAHAHLHVVPRWSDEPHAGKGIRWWIKQPNH